MGLSLVALGLAVYAAGYRQSHHGVLAGVDARDTWLALRGERLHARMYRSTTPPSPERKPGVVVLHGYLGNAGVMELPVAAELARRGFVVLSVTYPGHGRSGLGIRSFRDDDGRDDVRLRSVVAEIAVERLRGEADVDPKRIGLLGNSEGAKVAGHAGAHDRQIGATVYIAGPLDGYLFFPDEGPRNLLILVGGKDGLAPPDAPRLVADREWVVHPGSIAGDFATGSARKFVVAQRAGHLGILFDDDAREQAFEWLETALGARVSPAPLRRRHPPPIPLGWVAVAYAGLVAFMTGCMLLGRPGAAAPPGADASAASTSAAARWWTLYRAAVMLAAVWGSAWLITLWEHAFAWVPVSGGNRVLASLWAIASALLVATALGGAAGWRATLTRAASRGALATDAAFGAALALIVVAGSTVLARNYYDLGADTRRLVLWVLLAGLVLPPVAVWVAWVRRIVPAGLHLRPGARLALDLLLVAVAIGTALRAHLMQCFGGIEVTFLFITLAILSMPILTRDVQPHRIALATSFTAVLGSWLLSVMSPFYF